MARYEVTIYDVDSGVELSDPFEVRASSYYEAAVRIAKQQSRRHLQEVYDTSATPPAAFDPVTRWDNHRIYLVYEWVDWHYAPQPAYVLFVEKG